MKVMKYWTIGLAFLFFISFIQAAQMPVEATGDLGNQPEEGYSEDTEILMISDSDGVATTSFTPGETITVVVTSFYVNLEGNGQHLNVLNITDWQGNTIDSRTFNPGQLTDRFSYTATITAPNEQDHYLLTVELEDDLGNEFKAKEVIIVTGGPLISRYIKTYNDPNYSNLDYTFIPEQTIYLEVYAGETPSTTESTITFSDYRGGECETKIEDLDNDNITMSGNYARIEYNLVTDLDQSDLKEEYLTTGYWYTLSAELNRGHDIVITDDWSIQIQMVPPSLSVEYGGTRVDPDTVEREGEHQTIISTEFEDADDPSVDSFTVTFKIKDENGNELVLVDQRKDSGIGAYGGSLSITSSAPGVFTASYDFDPDQDFIIGDYDLYFKVDDGTGESMEDDYLHNIDELEITTSTIPPNVVHNSAKATPDSVDKIGVNYTSISARYSDEDSFEISDFTVTFKVRSQDNTVFTLVDDKGHGGAGEFGGTLKITSIGGVYTANYTFDPDSRFPNGDYDLYFIVTDQHGNSDEDPWGHNKDEMELWTSWIEPSLILGNTHAVPAEIDKAGSNETVITAQFYDADSLDLQDFKITLKLKNEHGIEYTLFDRAENGEAGEYGGTLTITSSSPGVYTASYIWDPPSSLTNGDYDLYFKVEDEQGGFVIDDYEDNQGELTVFGEFAEEDDGDGDVNLLPLFLLFIIILIVILIIFLILRKRKGKEKPSFQDMSPYPTQPAQPPQEPIPPPPQD